MAHTNGIGSTSTEVLQTLIGQSDRVGAARKETIISTAASRATDSAAFSSAASSLSQVAAATTSGDVRADKVAGIQAALAAGTYSVPAGAVADKLIQHLLG